MRIADLISVRPFPAVVQAADIRAARAGTGEGAADAFAAAYLGCDTCSAGALDRLIGSLSRPRGGAFFLNGVFGSGKSHLLGLVALLAEGRGRAAFAANHPQFAETVGGFPERLVIHCSLDDYNAARFSLEEIFWRELATEWRRHGWPANETPAPESGSRTEAFLALHEALQKRGAAGLVFCLDELSLFLSAREHRALQGDAAFLQFLGQRARREPLWVVAALQKTVEDIGDLEAYSLGQIRDRYTVLPLGLAHLPTLIEKRLVIRCEPGRLAQFCRKSFDELSRALPRLDFGPTEWEQLYPFHPATLMLLEAAVARFFSRTRSAVLFCAGTIDPAAEAGRRVAPDVLFDYLLPELAGHPDLRPLAEVWNAWSLDAPEIAPDLRDCAVLLRLMKLLLLCRIAGFSPTVLQLANALAFDAGLQGDGNYDYARSLLERLRARGSFLAVERSQNSGENGPYADRYTIDFGARIAEMARRQVRSRLDALPPGDLRIARFALACCDEGPLPFGRLAAEQAAEITWRNSPRRLGLSLWEESDGLRNRLHALGHFGNEEEALLLWLPPFTESGLAERAPAALRESIGGLPEERHRAAAILWMPRPPARDEWLAAREAAAAHLLENDPQLLDNRRGRGILTHLGNEASARRAQIARLVARLYFEGNLVTGAGAAIEAADLASGGTWLSALEAVAEFALPRVFPRFGAIAPTLRLLTPANSEALCLEILRRPADAPWFAASHERLARALAEPLGIARADAGRWRIAPPETELATDILSACRDGVPLSALEAVLASGEWGLPHQLARLALCALLRGGELTALDSRGAALAPASLPMPLARAVHTVRPGQLLERDSWRRIVDLVALLTGVRLGPVSFAAQTRAADLLRNWSAEAQAATELAQARLRQLRGRLGHSPSQWPQAAVAWEHIEPLLAALGEDAAAWPYLCRAVRCEAAALAPSVAAWRDLCDRLEARLGPLLAAYDLLAHESLAVPSEQAELRHSLLARFDAGEALLEDDDLLAECAAWRESYAAAYRAWHSSQHDPLRFAELRRLHNSDALRALLRLATLRNRPFPQGPQLRQAIVEEIDRGCPRDGWLRIGEALCNHCRLRHGEALHLRDYRELEMEIRETIAAFHRLLRDPELHERLAPAAAALLAWNGDSVSLLPLLSDEVLAALDLALQPRRRAHRSLKKLLGAFAACRTRADYETAFRQWLDAGESLEKDDEIDLVDGA